MAVSKAQRVRWASQWNSPDFIEKINKELSDPYGHSQLKYWLSLEAWDREEGLLILAGIEPGTVKRIYDVGIGFHWENAMPFGQNLGFFQFPETADKDRSEFSSDEDFDAYLERQEDRKRILYRHERLHDALEHKLNHSPGALLNSIGQFSFQPAIYLSWANSIGFKPDWYEWAQNKNVLPQKLDPMAVPFFDADSADYPELLVIAIRAWEHAKAATGGTPKQRIERFLVDRYPLLSQTTRESIAFVTNWQKVGGRPRDSK